VSDVWRKTEDVLADYDTAVEAGDEDALAIKTERLFLEVRLNTRDSIADVVDSLDEIKKAIIPFFTAPDEEEADDAEDRPDTE
jgi:hypothetical protein